MKTEMLYEGPTDFHEFLNLTKGYPCKITIEPVEGEKLRTAKQNKSYWKGCAIAAQNLTAGGWTRNKVFQIRKIELPWTKEAFHEDITKPFMVAAYDKDSSTKLSTVEMSQTWSKVQDQILLSTTNSDLGAPVNIGEFPSFR